MPHNPLLSTESAIRFDPIALSCPDLRRSLFQISNIKRQQIVICQVSMSKGLVRLRIREFAAQNGWTLKEVSDRSGVGYSTIRNYAQCQGMTTVNFAYLHRLARTFDVMIEDLVEILEE